MVVKSRSTGSGASKSNHPKFPGDQEMRWPGYNVIRFSGDMDVRYSSYDLDVRWQRYQFIRWFQEKLALTNGKELRIEMIEEERETLSKSIFSPDLSLWAKIGLKKFQYLEAFVFVKKGPLVIQIILGPLQSNPKVWNKFIKVELVILGGARGWSGTCLEFWAHARAGKKVSGPRWDAPGANFLLFEVKLPLMVSIKFNQNTLGGGGKKRWGMVRMPPDRAPL